MKLLVMLLSLAVSALAFAGSPAAEVASLDGAKMRVVRKASQVNDTEFKLLEVTTTRAGELSSLLDGKIADIDSLVVSGPIDSLDFVTMWDASFNGRTSAINLKGAKIANNRIPDGAFWHPLDQIGSDGGWEAVIYVPALRSISLPEGVEKIGSSAFAYTFVEDVEFPASLKSLGANCFSNCNRLPASGLHFKEGLEEIGQFAFRECAGLGEGTLMLPSSLKKIGQYAFYLSALKAVDLGEGLEEMEEGAFCASRLEEIAIPESCLTFTGGEHFASCYNLTTAALPKELRQLPDKFFYQCRKLENLTLPEALESVGKESLYYCESLKVLIFNEGLETIGENSLRDCRGLEVLAFPSTFKLLGTRSCLNLASLKALYCAATVCPVYDPGEVTTGIDCAFGNPLSFDKFETPQDVLVYVPVGSAGTQYEKNPNWAYFSNFQETDEFPTLGVATPVADLKAKDNRTFDLNGREVKNLRNGQIYIQAGQKFRYME